jgi:hypothetical protein
MPALGSRAHASTDCQFGSAAHVLPSMQRRPPNSLLERLKAHYDPCDLDDLYDLYGHAPELRDGVLVSLDAIRDIDGAGEVLADLTSTERKALGAEVQLAYAERHRDELEALAVPVAHETRDGRVFGREGVDAVRHDGTGVELKAYDFSSDYYRRHADAVAREVADQARSRIEQGFPGVDVVFSSAFGEMPPELRDALQREFDDDPRLRFRVE